MAKSKITTHFPLVLLLVPMASLDHPDFRVLGLSFCPGLLPPVPPAVFPLVPTVEDVAEFFDFDSES